MKGLYAAKEWYTRRLAFAVRWCVDHRVSPDVLSLAGVLSGVAGGAAVALGMWPAAIVFIAGRLAGANLDGAVARERQASRPFGFLVNELGDRLGDLALGAGLVAACYLTTDASPFAGWLALVCATLPTFVSLSGVGAGAPRFNGGPFGKTERCAAYVVAAFAVAFHAGLALSVVAAVIAVGSVVTALVRIRAIHRHTTRQHNEDDPA